MNNEINIILAMIAGSGAFKVKLSNNEIVADIIGLDFSQKDLLIPNWNGTWVCFTEGTILAKRVEDMSEEEHEIRRQKSHVDYFYNSFLSSPESERYVISKGYLSEYLANKLIENGINVEWI